MHPIHNSELIYEPAKTIAYVSNEIEERRDVTPDLLHLFVVKTRQHLEAMGYPQKFSWLYHYCNWVLHVHLIGPKGQDMATDLNHYHRSMEDNHRHSLVLGQSKLKDQFSGLFEELGASADWLDDEEVWFRFLTTLWHELAGKPVGFSDQTVEGRGKLEFREALANLRQQFPTTCFYRLQIVRKIRDSGSIEFWLAGYYFVNDPDDGSKQSQAFVEPILFDNLRPFLAEEWPPE